MLRITSGSAKNKKLKTPNIPNFRGVQEVAKLAMFAIVGEKIIDSTCLDLFTGSGNLGIEALSRGAKWCDFVDETRESQKAVEENLRNCDLLEASEVHRTDAIKYVVNTPQKYTSIFVDPFYKDLKHKFLIKNLEEILEDSGIIAFFHGKKLEMEPLLRDTSLQIDSQRKYGNSHLTLITKHITGS